MVKILCVGPLWRGSDAGALFKALSRIGCIIEVIDENYYIPLNGVRLTTKALSKILRDTYIKDFNLQIEKVANQFKPDLCLIYKGAFILPETIRHIKSLQTRLINFYPDVSFHTHGKHLPLTLPLYNHIFTTKTFGLEDMKNQLGITNTSFIPHGFDPEIHRPLKEVDSPEYYFSDVSFIGTWSKKKENFLHYIIQNIPNLNLKIWGGGWKNSESKLLKSFIQGTTISGDLYALAINNSKINLGILSEQVRGASSGDLITARTFHIPGAGGFLLHERTEESILYFVENVEAAFFSGLEDLVDKVNYFLKYEDERIKIAENGKTRAWKEHSLDERAKLLIQNLLELKII